MFSLKERFVKRQILQLGHQILTLWVGGLARLQTRSIGILSSLSSMISPFTLAFHRGEQEAGGQTQLFNTATMSKHPRQYQMS